MRNALNYILVLIVLVILLMKGCDKPGFEPPQTVIDTVYLKPDSVPYEVKVNVPKPFIVHDTVAIPANIDTLSILKDYYAVKEYSDTAVTKDSIKIIINDQISRNAITSRQVLAQDLRGRMVIRETTVSNKPHLYIGAMATIGNNNGTAPTITYTSKKDMMLMYGFDFINNSHHIGIGVKIK